jgi:hypothetical protein
MAVKEIEVQSEPDEPLAFLRPVPVSCAIAALAIIHYMWLISVPHKTLVCFIADDAFYELQIARHFLSSGKWSFDGGYTTTTGFHLLNVYLMSLIPPLLAHPWLAIKFWMAVGLTVSIFSVFTITNFVYEKFGGFALVPTFLVLTAPSFTLQSAGLLEYPYVILTASLYLSAIFLWSGEHRSMLFGVFLLGFIGSLARSDFGGLPLAIFLTCSIAFFLNHRSEYLLKSFCGLAGAAAGVASDFLHNFLFSGHFLSGSAMTKALWGKRVGYSALRPILLPFFTLTSSSLALLVIVSVFIVVLAVQLSFLATDKSRNAKLRTEWKEVGKYDRRLLASCGLSAIILYLLVYGAVPSFQPWYTVNFVIPVVLLLGAAGHLAAFHRTMRVDAIGVVALLAGVNILNAYDPPWNHQRYMLEMAEYLQYRPLVGRIGGWNVGIVGFFTDGRVINLDGLMNDQIYPYALNRTVEQYIDRARIKYIVDFPLQIEDPGLSEVLGFEGKSFAACLKPEHRIVSVDRGDGWLDYTLFEILDRSPKSQANLSGTVRQ